MKTVALTLCLAVGGVTAFAPSALPVTKAGALYSSIAPKRDDWSDMPLHQRADSPSQPVRKVNWFEKQRLGDVMIDPDYTLPLGLTVLGFLIMWYHPCKSEI
jgi:hypothetical protein